jgi:hypothetical protein
MTKPTQKHETTTELIQKLAAIGRQMDQAAPDHALMGRLLRERRVVVAQIEARHAARQN